MWVDAEEEMGLSNPMADPAKVAEVRDDIYDKMMARPEKRLIDAQSDLDEFRALLGPKRSTPAPGSPAGAIASDLADLRERLKGGEAATVADPSDE